MTTDTLDQTFEALSNAARRDIVAQLSQAPHTAGALAQQHAISRPAVSRHLRVLRDAGLVTAEKQGREWVYTLAPAGLRDAQRWLAETRETWSDALQSLKDYVERGE
jgi:DNA-binding transcriptional ArsR family regulator